LRRAKSAAEYGVVRSYFIEQMDWEAAMRQQFHNLAQRLQGREDCQPDALAALNQLNRRYKTRFKSSSLPILRDELLAMLWSSDWLLAAPPQLLECPEDHSQALSAVISNVLQRTRLGGANRPYSLVTKFLHFCFPATFTIYDSQAAKSIHMWAIFAFDEDDAAQNADAGRFDEVALGDTGGHGYLNVLSFYRTIWDAGTPDDKSALNSQAAQMEELLRGQGGESPVRVTTIDLIDKLLWRANGNPFRLGLAAPPSTNVEQTKRPTSAR
jgi:hypothetical protein